MLGVEMISFFALLELSILCLPTPSTDSVIPVQEDGYRSDSSNLTNQRAGFIIYQHPFPLPPPTPNTLHSTTDG